MFFDGTYTAQGEPKVLLVCIAPSTTVVFVLRIIVSSSSSAFLIPGLGDVIHRVCDGPLVPPGVGGLRWLEECVPTALWLGRYAL